MFLQVMSGEFRDRPDVCIVDLYAFAGIDAAQSLGIPLVLNSPSLLMDTSNHLPAFGPAFSFKMALWERCISHIYSRIMYLSLSSFYLRLNQLRIQRGLQIYRNSRDFCRNATLMVNTSPYFDFPYSTSVLHHFTGPIMPPSAVESEALSLSISKWLDSDKTPVVAVFFGTGVMSTLNTAQVRTLAKAFMDSRMRILWALPNERKQQLGSIPSSFRIRPHLNPISVLSHANVRAVICSCGIALAQESIYFGKPLLCLPASNDQYDIATRIIEAGVGLFADKQRLEVSDLRQKIVWLLTNSSFSANSKRMGALLKIQGGVTYAADIVENVLRNGIAHIPPNEEESYSDVILLFCVVLALASIVLFLMFRYLFYIVQPFLSTSESYVMQLYHIAAGFVVQNRLNNDLTKLLQLQQLKSSASRLIKDAISFPSPSADPSATISNYAVNASQAVTDVEN